MNRITKTGIVLFIVGIILLPIAYFGVISYSSFSGISATIMFFGSIIILIVGIILLIYGKLKKGAQPSSDLNQ